MVFSSKNKSYSISISIPSQNDCKKLTVSEHELIHCIKQKIIKEYNSSDFSNNLTNNGLLLVSKKKDIRRFLDEKDEIGDLHKYASDFRLEFVPKYKISSKEDQSNNSNAYNSDIQKRFIEILKNDNDNKVKDILDLGVDPNFVSENGETPISICIFKNKIDLIKMMLDYGAYVDYKIPRSDKWITYLQYAILCKNFECFKFLIEKGAWIEDTDKQNRTALYYAIKIKNIDYVSYLLKNGASVQCVDSKGLLPLHYACKKGDEKIVQYLIDYGSDMNFVDSNGNTPLHIAMKYNYKECVRCLLIRGSRKDLPNNEGQKPVDINRSNKCDEETIKMVESFDCTTVVPPPPSFKLLTQKDIDKFEKTERKEREKSLKGEKKKKQKKKKSIVVRIPPSPPPPPLLYTPKMVSDLSEVGISNLDREKSTSSPSVANNSTIKQFKPKLEKAQSNKNIAAVPIQPTYEPNIRRSLRQNSKVQTVPNIYDSSIYAPNSDSTTPLSRSIDLSPKTAVNPEDQTSPSVETPRTAFNINDSSISIDLREDEDGNFIKSSSTNVSIGGSNVNINNSTTNIINISSTDVSHLISSANDISHYSYDGGSLNDLHSTNSIGGSGRNFETKDDLVMRRSMNHVPKIETTKIILKNLVLSNPNLSTLTESPRSAIYVPSPRKPSRFVKNNNFSSASSLLNAFIKNDTTTILDNILNIDLEKDDKDSSEDTMEDINKDVDIINYDYSNECRTEDNPNLELINKKFNTELINYIKNLNVINEGEIIAVDPEKSKKQQRNKLIINDKDYQNSAINNKELLLETYEKLYLILADIQHRSKKAKESIEQIKEEHNTLIEEIKIVRDKELKIKDGVRDSSKLRVSINEEINTTE